MLLFPQWRNQFWMPIGGYDGEQDNQARLNGKIELRLKYVDPFGVWP